MYMGIRLNLFNGGTPLVGAPDGASAPHGHRHSPAGAAAFARSPRTTRTPVWQRCTGDHHPSLGQDGEAFGHVRSFDDLHLDLAQGATQAGLELRAGVAAIGVELEQEGVEPEEAGHQQHASIAVLDVGRMHDGVQQQTLRVYQDVALLALDLLARIIPVPVDAGPPFSALLTLWLSMIAAVGLASRPAFSRHWT